MTSSTIFSDDPNVQAIRESFGRVVYSHKTHEKAREIESSKATAVKVMNIFLATATSTSLITTIIVNQRVLLYVGSIISAVTLAFLIFQLSFDPAKEAERHRDTAGELWYIREQYINLLADIKTDPASVNIRNRRDHLINDLKKVYAAAPDTSRRAYKIAQAALKISEDMTFSDEEINQFLPNALHLSDQDEKSSE